MNKINKFFANTGIVAASLITAVIMIALAIVTIQLLSTVLTLLIPVACVYLAYKTIRHIHANQKGK
jgi:1,4-dihydroxy-2-naphthoate octaprenyltransferase